MIGAGQAAAAKAGGAHSEVAAVLLHQQVRRYLRNAEEAVRRLVDRHGFGNAVGGVGVFWYLLPSVIELDQRQRVRPYRHRLCWSM